MIKNAILFCLFVSGLSFFFIRQEQMVRSRLPRLEEFPSAVVQKAALGYFTQIGAELQFIQTAVFLGKVQANPSLSEISYAPDLSYNFKTITDLYPQFTDSYYLCQSSLAHIAPEYAVKASELLMKGALSNPDNIILPFFAGFNYFYYANDNKKASKIYLELAQHDNAPKWVGHLAAVLSAKDGNLYAGLSALQLMLKATTDEKEKIRYERDIKIFKSTLKVADATRLFYKKYQKYPVLLKDLIPEFIDELPDTGEMFRLRWNGENVTLVRPSAKEKENYKTQKKPLVFI